MLPQIQQNRQRAYRNASPAANLCQRRDCSRFWPRLQRARHSNGYVHRHLTVVTRSHNEFQCTRFLLIANLSLDVVKSLPESLHTGVYYGWSNVNNGEVYKMVLSVGWNPFYNNKEKSVETHMLHKFNCDLYGQTLKICIVGYLRPEKNFDSLDDLIKVIKSDIEQAKTLLDQPENRKLQEAPFFSDKISKC